MTNIEQDGNTARNSVNPARLKDEAAQAGASLRKAALAFKKRVGLDFDPVNFKAIHWQGSFEEYLEKVLQNPTLTRTAAQRIYDMISSAGTEKYTRNGQEMVHYKFFDDPYGDRKDAIFGMDKSIMDIVSFIQAAAMGYGMEKRILLLKGPVGSAKSTIVRLIKRGLEKYTATQNGALYTLGWVTDPKNPQAIEWCPVHEDPLHALETDQRKALLENHNSKRPEGVPPWHVDGDLCSFCRKQWEILESDPEIAGNPEKVIERIRVKRTVFSEANRVGIGTFEPKDEKNQDSTELTGDINYRKIAIYGSDSDPRAFNFDGELQIANRGLVEFAEVLKLDVAFLYTLLFASQERTVKAKKFAQSGVDLMIVGHTNEPEVKRLEKDERMQAFRDRTIQIVVPYVLKVSDETKIYEKDFTTDKVGMHIAPHTVEMLSLFTVATRLDKPKKADMTTIQKAYLYDGKSISGYTEAVVEELRKEAPNEGRDGVSPRLIQDILAACLTEAGQKDPKRGINAFMALNKIESAVRAMTDINEDKRKYYLSLLDDVRKEFDEIAKREIQLVIAGDEEVLNRLLQNYLKHMMAYTQKEKVKNPHTGIAEEPDERFMRDIEERVEISEGQKDDFRQSIVGKIAARGLTGLASFDLNSHEKLKKALQAKAFADQRDTINLASLVMAIPDKETQKRLDTVKQRLIDRFGYNEHSATDLMTYVGSLFARGQARK